MQAVFGASAAWNVVERRRKPRKKADSAAPIGGRLGWAMELLGEHGLWVRYVGIRGTGPRQARPQRGTLSHHASCHQIPIPVSRYQPIPARNLNAVRQLICVSCPVPHPTPPAAAGLRSRICGGIQTRQIFWKIVGARFWIPKIPVAMCGAASSSYCLSKLPFCPVHFIARGSQLLRGVICTSLPKSPSPVLTSSHAPL
jgi:hypothetical protein